jgi:hypothetical protein
MRERIENRRSRIEDRGARALTAARPPRKDYCRIMLRRITKRRTWFVLSHGFSHTFTAKPQKAPPTRGRPHEQEEWTW